MTPSGCAIVPYPVNPEVDRFDNVHLAGDTLVTVGPRVALEKVSERIEKKNSKVEVIDPILFRDSAFPQGGWQLEELLDHRLKRADAQMTSVNPDYDPNAPVTQERRKGSRRGRGATSPRRRS